MNCSLFLPFALSVYYFTFNPYQRSFTRPLNTHHGEWKIRKGIIICLKDEQGQETQGEITPLPWFGSETLEEALDHCQNLGKFITEEQILSIPDHLPACQFGFESALISSGNIQEQGNYSYLLPTGKDALNQWKRIYNEAAHLSGIITFKWKIGVDPPKIELNLWEKLMTDFPESVKLRLDANGGLTLAQAKEWLKQLNQDKRIEFLEQPLSASEFDAMLELSQNYTTPLALDESVSTLSSLKQCYQQGWRGIYVIKASIMGYPSDLVNFLNQNSLDCVFSSVFETEIGRKAVLKLAQKLGNPERALGFGVNHWFI